MDQHQCALVLKKLNVFTALPDDRNKARSEMESEFLDLFWESISPLGCHVPMKLVSDFLKLIYDPYLSSVNSEDLMN